MGQVMGSAELTVISPTYSVKSNHTSVGVRSHYEALSGEEDIEEH